MSHPRHRPGSFDFAPTLYALAGGMVIVAVAACILQVLA